ncbi:hypothetical protein [Thiolapillus sp.]
MQQLFGTTALSGIDWILAVLVASSAASHGERSEGW